MTSPVVVETVSTVANQVTSPLTVPRRRSQEGVEVGEPATNVARTGISQETVLLNPVAEVEIASIVANLVTSARTVWRRRNLEEVVAVEPVMDVEKKVINRETVLQRLVEGVEDVLTVVRRVTSYVSSYLLR